ncbi:MAG: hypothetical protein E6356_13815 [Terrisporobacter othiniensis]|nr:hypothetical protein [Terrisporobacter othiniensis]
MNKEENIKYIKSLPNDITILTSRDGTLEDEYNRLDMIVFTEEKSREFLEWYLAP